MVLRKSIHHRVTKNFIKRNPRKISYAKNWTNFIRNRFSKSPQSIVWKRCYKMRLLRLTNHLILVVPCIFKTAHLYLDSNLRRTNLKIIIGLLKCQVLYIMLERLLWGTWILKEVLSMLESNKKRIKVDRSVE